MLVKDIMTEPVVTIREDQSILEAREIMRGKRLISLPVVDDMQRVRGIITSASNDGMTEILIDAQNRGESNENAVSRSQ